MRISGAMSKIPWLPFNFGPVETVWFGARSCVVVRGNVREVFVGGFLLGRFSPDDVVARNVLLTTLAADDKVHLGQLADAFGVSPEAARQIRRLHEEDGVEAVVARRGPGRQSQVTDEVRLQLEKLFSEGATIEEAFKKLGPKKARSRSTVGRIRRHWKVASTTAARAGSDTLRDATPMLAASMAVADAQPPASGSQPETLKPASEGVLPAADDGAQETSAPAAEPVVPHESSIAEPEEGRLVPRAPQNAAHVQHLGSWLLIATTSALGLHQRALAVAGRRVRGDALRLALDAVLVALALGEKCVEGVRRIATDTASALLLATGAPSPTWTRRMLGRFAAMLGAPLFQLGMMHEYLARARAEDSDEGFTYYVDNHLRPYTGQHTLRSGWRMQEKRARPGVSDYYVHDEEGRPVRHVVVPSHGSLTAVLTPIARFLRDALGPEERILLAFDRGGSFPNEMAELRDEDFEFVTYERGPYPKLAKNAFEEKLTLKGQEYRWCESGRANLGRGRGRVRRICVLSPENRQLNLLATSGRPAPRLIEVMLGRWVQENAFKHANERWGLNQLDGRRVRHYEPDTIIPNPSRRRLDAAIRAVRHEEGLARAALARLGEEDPRRAELEQDIAAAVTVQEELTAKRPTMPSYAPIKETDLAGKLVHHTVEYKLVLDTIRAACVNAEADLAALLAPHLPRAAEAKKALANLFAAPGRISVAERRITITLSPAGTAAEQVAFNKLTDAVNRRRLTLPGDQERRRLCFAIAPHS